MSAYLLAMCKMLSVNLKESNIWHSRACSLGIKQQLPLLTPKPSFSAKFGRMGQMCLSARRWHQKICWTHVALPSEVWGAVILLKTFSSSSVIMSDGYECKQGSKKLGALVELCHVPNTHSRFASVLNSVANRLLVCGWIENWDQKHLVQSCASHHRDHQIQWLLVQSCDQQLVFQ